MKVTITPEKLAEDKDLLCSVINYLNYSFEDVESYEDLTVEERRRLGHLEFTKLTDLATLQFEQTVTTVKALNPADYLDCPTEMDVVNKIIKEYYLEKDVDSCKLTHNEQYKLFFDRWRELKDKNIKWAVYENVLASSGLLSYTDKKEKADPWDPKVFKMTW